MKSSSRINENDISIIIQGSIYNYEKDIIDANFYDYLDTLLNVFRACEIIVSTWDIPESDKKKVTTKYCDVIFIFNRDVGILSRKVDGLQVVSNVNRMIVSSLEGLKNSTKPYAIKIRTDSYLYNKSIISLIEKIMSGFGPENMSSVIREQSYKVFDDFVINCNLFARNPYSHLPFLFHPGDILFAGKKSDLLKIFDIPLADETIFKRCESLRNTCYMRYVPEQYIWVECIKKHKGLEDFFPGNFNNSKDWLEKSERFYFNNFIPYSAKQLGFHWPKHKTVYYNKGNSSIYNIEDWCNLYTKYVLNEKPNFSFEYKKRSLVILFMKIYFFVRTKLLRIRLVRRLAYKIFVKRG